MDALLNHLESQSSVYSQEPSLYRALSESEALPLIYEYWDDKRGSRLSPLESDLNPALDIPTVASHVVYVDVEQQGSLRRFRSRPGNGAVPRQGDGEYFEERLSGDLLDRILRSCNQACDTGVPQFVILDPTVDFPYYYCRLCVPLSRDGAAIDVLLHAVDVLSPYNR